MKKYHLKWLALAAVCCIAAFILMGAARDPQQQMVENLLKTRTDVMENVLFGKITYEEGKEQLKEIEGETLYRKDLQSLQQYEATDLDRVLDMEILSFVRKSDLYGIMTFATELRWTCEGYEGVYHETGKYQISVAEKEDRYRLISMELQEE